jgi:coiled-coil domain-containing protein 55
VLSSPLLRTGVLPKERNRNSQARVCSPSNPKLAADAGMQRYGLQLRKKPAGSSSSRPAPPARPLAAFADDGDDDVEADILRQSSKKRALQKVTRRPGFQAFHPLSLGFGLDC